MSDVTPGGQPPAPGWWQAPDGGWHPPRSDEQRDDAVGTDGTEPKPAADGNGSGPRRRWRWLLLGVVVVAAISIAAALLSHRDDDDVTIRGEFTLTDTDNVVGDFESCSGAGGYDDFGPGMNVVIRDRQGGVVATSTTRSLDASHYEFMLSEPRITPVVGQLSADDNERSERTVEDGESAAASDIQNLYEAMFDIFGCSVVFEVQAPREEFYAIEVGSRGELTYSFDELEEDHFYVQLTLGD